MALTLSNMMTLGQKAPDFELPDVLSGTKKTLDSIRGTKGTMITFICNHCPYVVHVQDEIARMAHDYQSKGIAFLAISSNDAENYPTDSPEHLANQAKQVGFAFPYLYDESQDVAKAYMAACTPDFYLFDSDNACVYRGRMDDSTPGNGNPVTGKDLRSAMDGLLNNVDIPSEQFPSMGCNIKWK
ncbi:MAG: thioredoxin family protein [Cyclobacteriaceae bacterium]|nr:thioredoxin family protein [Cyclobacteriaceae bacterium HetDA_MAG_MS6]